jgi:hypothetical protein
MAVLEPELFEESAVWAGGMTRGKNPRPTFNKASKDYKEFLAEQTAQGKAVLDPAEMSVCRNVARAVRKHPAAGDILTGGEAEVSIQWTHATGIECKSRLDYVSACAVDLKSARDIRPVRFGWSCYEFAYHAQAAMYQDAVKALTGEVRPFLFVAVEKVRPFDVVVYRATDNDLAAGRALYTDWMLKLATCLERDEWPGLSDRVEDLQLPERAFDEWDDATVTMADGRTIIA